MCSPVWCVQRIMIKFILFYLLWSHTPLENQIPFRFLLVYQMWQRFYYFFICSLYAPAGPVLYDLYAICNHVGTVNMGHYTACCLDENGWCVYNDSRWDSWLNNIRIYLKSCPVLSFERQNRAKQTNLIITLHLTPTVWLQYLKTSSRRARRMCCSTNGAATAAAAPPASGNKPENDCWPRLSQSEPPYLRCP